MQIPEALESWIKILSIGGGAIAFCWGVFQFLNTQHTQAETRRIEATRPFLDRQLKLYTEATQIAATLVTSKNIDVLANANERFWSLYWGELSLVEDKRVEAAMVQFGRALEKGTTGQQLNVLSLQLAHACRDSLADSWGVKQWQNPHTVNSN
jgi:hypothetical protein